MNVFIYINKTFALPERLPHGDTLEVVPDFCVVDGVIPRVGEHLVLGVEHAFKECEVQEVKYFLCDTYEDSDGYIVKRLNVGNHEVAEIPLTALLGVAINLQTV